MGEDDTMALAEPPCQLPPFSGSHGMLPTTEADNEQRPEEA
jgi:hypothetical protein